MKKQGIFWQEISLKGNKMRKKTRKGFGEKLGSCYDFLLEIEDFSDIVTSPLGHNLKVGSV